MAGRMRGSTADRLTPCVTTPYSNASGTTRTTRCSMTNADLLREARKLDAEATPGPWLASEYLDDGRIGILTASNRIVVALRSGVATKQDATFIARARTLLPQLADAYVALHAEVRELAVVSWPNGRLEAKHCSLCRRTWRLG